MRKLKRNRTFAHDRSALGSRMAALGTSQSSVRARIKTLEQDLGILLFERWPRDVRLTEAVRHFVDEIVNGGAKSGHWGGAKPGQYGR